MDNLLNETVIPILQFFAVLFVVAVGFFIAWIIALYIVDVRQTRHAIRRNYPVIGRFRYWFEHLGEFFRQYFFALDREELPFNRAQRTWVYKAAKDLGSNIAFGSTEDITRPGTMLFANSVFPVLEENAKPAEEITFGPYCQKSYTTSSFFNISGMSYGAISRPAIIALSNGAKQAGCWLNTGEGGLSPYHLQGGADLVFQIGTAKYGVRNEKGELCDTRLKEVASHKSVKMFELKLSQGAKPGKGGILPAIKVTEEIASIRGIQAAQASMSPNAHPEIQSLDDLLDMLARIRNVTAKPVGFKAVIGEAGWLADLCELINRRGADAAPDFITIDGADGGSGAAPQPLMDYVGLPLQESLPLLVATLESFNLRKRIKIIASGKLITPSRVAWAMAIGADAVTSARGFMFSLGCIQALQCHKNTCPTGITTHDVQLQRGLDPANKTQRVANYQNNIVKGVEQIAHACGAASPRDLKPEHIYIIPEKR